MVKKYLYCIRVYLKHMFKTHFECIYTIQRYLKTNAKLIVPAKEDIDEAKFRLVYDEFITIRESQLSKDDMKLI